MAVETTTATRTVPAQAQAHGRNASFLRVVKVIWLREMIVYSRDRARVISSMVMPILLLVIFGEGLGNTVGNLGEGVNYRQFIFPGVVGMNILFTSVFSGTTIIWDRQFGFLREILVAPISRTAIGAGKIIGGSTIAVFQGCILFALAPVVGVHLSVIVMLELLGVMSIMALAMTGLGIALASRMRTVEGFQMITQVTIMPSMFLSGMFFPVNSVPAWMEVLIKINPVTYAIAPVRSIALHKELTKLPPGAGAQLTNVEVFGHVMSTLESIGIVAAFGAVVLMFAVQSFRRSE